MIKISDSALKLFSIILKLPMPLKKRIDKTVERGFRSQFILSAIEKELKRKERRKMADEILNNEETFSFRNIERDTQTYRLYSNNK